MGKNISTNKLDLMVFVDINNVFNLQYIAMQGFDGGDDWRNYLESLHLPMYNDEQYVAAGYTGGKDKVGDVYSDDKPHINMPNREFLSFLNPRSITLGIRINF
jgi:hypothetical protein